ncbi:hypothetical protein D3C72_1242350 [compost metagenome]
MHAAAVQPARPVDFAGQVHFRLVVQQRVAQQVGGLAQAGRVGAKAGAADGGKPFFHQ